MIKVLIVDGRKIDRESLKAVLSVSADIKVTDAVSNVAEALKSAAQCQSDVVVMDICMPDMDGVEGIALFKSCYPQIKVIILTISDNDESVFGALKSGASGYLLKESNISNLSEAIRIAHSGGAMINPNIASKMISQFSVMVKNSAQPQVDKELTANISKREWQIIRTIGEGMSNKEIAQELCLSEGTIRNSISSILFKLNLRDRTQLAIWAVRTGVANGGLI